MKTGHRDLAVQRSWTTHSSRRRFSQRATGVPWNLTFADAAEKVTDGESGHPQVAITDLAMAPAERLQPKGAYSRCRPISAGRLFEMAATKPS
jgi:hypothetical protein